MADTRIAYGARCTWWDGIANVGLTEPGRSGHRIPCCPQCGSMLFEMESEEPWWDGVRKHESNGNAGYRLMMEWARGKCFPNLAALELTYAAATMVREVLPSAADLALAQDIIDSSPVINVFAASEWREMGEDGQVWLAAIVAESTKRAQEHSVAKLRIATEALDRIGNSKVAFDAHPAGVITSLQEWAREASSQIKDTAHG